MNNIQEAQLLRENVSALVEQLNDLGFTEVTTDTPLSLIADYMRWAGGLRDLRLATINKYTGEYADYSREEWSDMSASSKSAVIKLGIRIRAERRDFIIAKDYALRDTGAIDMPWSSVYSDVKGLTNYGPGSTGMMHDFDAKGNTDAIIASGQTDGVTYEAAIRARAYKASTVADGGYDDPTEWNMPAVGHLMIIYKYKKEINEAITFFFGASSQLIADVVHWSSDEYSSTNAITVSMYYGYISNGSKTSSYRVRPVASVPVSSAN